MSTSLSQDNIQVNDKVSEEKETLFKNKLQRFQQSDNKPTPIVIQERKMVPI